MADVFGSGLKRPSGVKSDDSVDVGEEGGDNSGDDSSEASSSFSAALAVSGLPLTSSSGGSNGSSSGHRGSSPSITARSSDFVSSTNRTSRAVINFLVSASSSLYPLVSSAHQPSKRHLMDVGSNFPREPSSEYLHKQLSRKCVGGICPVCGRSKHGSGRFLVALTWASGCGYVLHT